MWSRISRFHFIEISGEIGWLRPKTAWPMWKLSLKPTTTSIHTIVFVEMMTLWTNSRVFPDINPLYTADTTRSVNRSCLTYWSIPILHWLEQPYDGIGSGMKHSFASKFYSKYFSDLKGVLLSTVVENFNLKLVSMNILNECLDHNSISCAGR